MEKELERLSPEELHNLYRQLEEELAELEEEQRFVLGQTRLHVPGHLNKKYQTEIARLQERLAKIRQLLEQKANP